MEEMVQQYFHTLANIEKVKLSMEEPMSPVVLSRIRAWSGCARLGDQYNDIMTTYTRFNQLITNKRALAGVKDQVRQEFELEL